MNGITVKNNLSMLRIVLENQPKSEKERELNRKTNPETGDVESLKTISTDLFKFAEVYEFTNHYVINVYQYSETVIKTFNVNSETYSFELVEAILQERTEPTVVTAGLAENITEVKQFLVSL